MGIHWEKGWFRTIGYRIITLVKIAKVYIPDGIKELTDNRQNIIMTMKIDSRERLVREIADAMQSFTNEFDNRWFLNLTEQEVGIRVDPAYCDPDCLWPSDDDEVIEIDPVPSHEAFQAMEAFANEQPRPIAEKLYRALSGNRPFARFKAAADVLDLLQDWYDYQNKWYMEKAEEWMMENGVSFKDGKVVCTGRTMTWFEESEDEEEVELDDY